MRIQQKAHSSLPSFTFGRFFSVVASKKLKLESEVANSPRAGMSSRQVGHRSLLMMRRRSTGPTSDFMLIIGTKIGSTA